MSRVTISDIDRARSELSGITRVTPMQHSRVLAERHQTEVYLKCENLQRTGSFKLRGAYTRLRRLDPDAQRAGVVAASAGNHAQGVALAASLLGIHSTVFMPQRVPLPKLEATKGYGADTRLHGAAVEETLQAAEEYAQSTGAELIHPFDHPDVIAGQATMGMEVLEQVPQLGTILVPLGGGGLLAGTAAAVKEKAPQAKVIGVQAAQAAAWPASLRAGEPRSLSQTSTMADGIAVGRPGELTFEHVAELVDDVLTVGEDALSQALLFCLERNKMLAEPAGAAAVAALLGGRAQFPGPIVAVLSGGNLDPLLLQQVIRHGMAAAGRYLQVTVQLTDRPGSLAGLLATVGELGANIVDVQHTRLSGVLTFGQVEVSATMETRGPEHREQVLDVLRHAGYVET